MKIPFITGEAPEGNYPINWYFLPEKINGRNAMVGTPGLKLKYDTKNGFGTRGVYEFRGSLYAVAGKTLYRITASGAINTVGDLATSEGLVQMKDNGRQLMIIDGAKGYICQGLSVNAITDPDFPIPSALAYQDGYFIVIEKGTQNFYVSGLYDGTAWEALDFSAAEGWPDNALAIIMDHRELWIFQEDTIEIFYNSGNADFPFEKVPGGFIENGIGAANSVVKMDNSIFWLDDNFMFRRARGFQPEIISPPKLNQIIAKYQTKTDAFAYSYVLNGCTFYVICFPTESKTWVFNALTNAWHQWASGAMQLRHRASCCVKFDNQYVFGDYDSGKIYELDDEIYTDNGEIIKSTRITPPITTPDRVHLFFHDLEIELEQGVGLATGQGSDPQCMLSWSDDKGKTWSNELLRTIGKAGEYNNRAVWDALGSSRERMFKIEITDPVQRTLISANSNISRGIH